MDGDEICAHIGDSTLLIFDVIFRHKKHNLRLKEIIVKNNRIHASVHSFVCLEKWFSISSQHFSPG